MYVYMQTGTGSKERDSQSMYRTAARPVGSMCACSVGIGYHTKGYKQGGGWTTVYFGVFQDILPSIPTLCTYNSLMCNNGLQPQGDRKSLD